MQPPLSKPGTLKTLHLKISVLLILIIGAAYGLWPNKILPKLFDFSADTTDLKNVFRATMGLYFGMVAIWMAGIIKEKYWVTATITNIAFMGGLAIGRLISLVADGLPAVYFSGGLIVEIILACWGIYNLRRYSAKE
jgi:Domain of unknown function (DUF4345)